MNVTISKTFDFDAAHRLTQVPDGHKCSRLHGHTYRVEIILQGEPDARGFVVDYAEIATAWAQIHDELDHRYLNDVEGLENPTTEVLAPWIAGRLRRTLPCIVALRVYESSTTWCEVRMGEVQP
jgi:6-pyruvoyltetrahydropterin/6-carboxytetrahydropterin synthase